MKIERKIEEKPRFEVIQAQHIFTKDEMVSVGQELGRENGRLSQAEANKKEITSQLKAEEDSIQARIDELARKASNGYEFRDHKCEVKLVPKERKKQLIFNGEVKQEKTMTPDEFQCELPLPAWEYDSVTCINQATIIATCGEWSARATVWQDRKKVWLIGDDPTPFPMWVDAVRAISGIIAEAAEKQVARKEKDCLKPRKLWKESCTEFGELLSTTPVIPGEIITVELA